MLISRALLYASALSLCALLGCDDTLFGTPISSSNESPSDDTSGVADDSSAGVDDTSLPSGDEPFCDVLSAFAASCWSCHSGSAPLGDLDLKTDPHGALVGQPSALYAGATLVVAGDPEGSLLYAKVSGGQASDQGTAMPPTALMDDPAIEAVRLWIDEGAAGACGGEVDTAAGERYHPDGWSEPGAHGMAAKFQEDACLSCHGDDLGGGSVGISCDACHDSGWRTECTFCHGGEDNETGAPPRDIDGATSGLTFSPHTAHVTTNIHGAYDCVQCHVKPTDVLSAGHFLVDDVTPGVAEVRFSGGLSASGSYSGGSCSNLYCHGSGQGDDGSANVGQSFSSCDSCHPDLSSGRDGWGRMSGEHEDHLEDGRVCSDCHGLTVRDGQEMSDPDRHVDGTIDLRFDGSISMSGETCNGTCHGESHDDRDWD